MTGLSEKYGLSEVEAVDVRVARRSPLKDATVLAICNSTAEQRLEYAIKRIADMQEVWTVWEGDKLPEFEGEQGYVVWCWPDREFAERAHSSTLTDPQIVPIPINDFLDEVLSASNCDVGVFPMDITSRMRVMTPDDFAAAIGNESARYVKPTNMQTLRKVL